jgi:hypothetical protein
MEGKKDGGSDAKSDGLWARGRERDWGIGEKNMDEKVRLSDEEKGYWAKKCGRGSEMDGWVYPGRINF